MLTIIIGHRGCGKTNLLSYLESSEVLCIDLDLKITQACGESVESLFLNKGEKVFRNLEKNTLYKLIKKHQGASRPVYISVGAGFLEEIPDGVKVVWLQRKTDAQARTFFNRPRLDKEKSPSKEYKSRFLAREKYYGSVAHEIICLPEHIVKSQLDSCKHAQLSVENFFTNLQKFMALYFSNQPTTLNTEEVTQEKNNFFSFSSLNKAGITLTEEMFADRLRGEQFLKKRLSWGLLFFEVTDQLISKSTFVWIKSIVPPNRLLLSCRSLKTYFTQEDLQSSWAWDWPIEKTIKACPFKLPFSIISLHSNIKEKIEDNGVYLKSQMALANKHNLQYGGFKKVHGKWAPSISGLSELQKLYDWFKKDKSGRSILPMSEDGRWAWFRLYLYEQTKLSFVKESRGGIFKDQILLADKLFSEHKKADKNTPKHFAAILGQPVTHSLTPFIHYDFFQSKNISIYSVELKESEVSKQSIDFLIQLGLRYAAITSPLKKAFFNLGHDQLKPSCLGKKFQSVNTLAIFENTKKGILDNTDQEGLVALVNSAAVDKKTKALWGAGAISLMLKKVFAEVCIFSAQKKQCVNRSINEEAYCPEVILWAVPSIYKHSPPKHWKPGVVIDLNYSEDSGGREYAMLNKATYINGLLMFLVQAKAQQKIWNNV
ncbi:MAG: hypothetical protein HAW63_02345 [Bdellovibrionaceae bacterium]|nr:hypothetical protein [Pseudobdellovibrionaceae bacterium]